MIVMFSSCTNPRLWPLTGFPTSLSGPCLLSQYSPTLTPQTAGQPCLLWIFPTWRALESEFHHLSADQGLTIVTIGPFSYLEQPWFFFFISLPELMRHPQIYLNSIHRASWKNCLRSFVHTLSLSTSIDMNSCGSPSAKPVDRSQSIPSVIT